MPVVPATRFALLLPAAQNSSGAGDHIPYHHALIRFLRRSAIGLAVTLVLAFVLGGAVSAATIDTSAPRAILVDDETGTVLLERNADEPVSPASMSKVMTLYLVFERLAQGRLSLEDTLPVSEKAWRMGGSKMFVEVGDRVSVEDLLRGVIVQSGNDACIVLAEGLAGSEEAFVAEMNERAKELGLTRSSFKNTTGWPEEGHVMSARDVAIISHRVIQDFPQFYRYFAEKEFTYNDIRQGNRNPLLYKEVGADGLKTGHTSDSGYSLAASAVREGRRLILVVSGLKSANERSRESERLLDYGFREFANYRLFEAGDRVADAEVWLGESSSVPLVIEQDLVLTLSREARPGLRVSVLYEGPVPAPIERGAEVARLMVSAPELESREIPLVAGTAIPRLGGFSRLGAAINYLLWGPQGD